jgi:hypothetical protein
MKLSKNVVVSIFAGMAFLLSLMALPASAQDLEKKYAPIVGDYEFDMSESGMGVMTIKFYVENDALWVKEKNSFSPSIPQTRESGGWNF